MQQAHQRELTILDGGMGHLLKQWGLKVPGLPDDQQFLAGVLSNETSPQQITAAHKAYISAGCNCITTNSFAATQHNLSKVERQQDQQDLIQAAAQLARAAATSLSSPLQPPQQQQQQQQKQQQQRKQQGQPTSGPVQVAGSLPPLCESYQVQHLPSHEDMVREYSLIATALFDYVDVYLAETLSTIAEAVAVAEATACTGKPLWLSFTLEDSLDCCLRGKETLQEALAKMSSYAHLQAVLVNCCAPAAVTAALPVLKEHVRNGVWIGAYANGFQTTTTEWMASQTDPQASVIGTAALPFDAGDYDASGMISPEAYLNHARVWRSVDASIIGGCCGIRPQHIQLLADHLR
eukprot:jgi/Chrzof1/11249/Cz05g29120.t1